MANQEIKISQLPTTTAVTDTTEFEVNTGGVSEKATGLQIQTYIGGGTTNLTYTATPTDGTVESDTGTDATIPAGSAVNASLLLPADKTKLDGIATGATANSTDAFLLDRTNHTGTQTLSTISDSGALAALNIVDNAEIADNAVNLAKIASGPAGTLITFSPAGDPALVTVGLATQVLTSNGAGAAPTFQSLGTASAEDVGTAANNVPQFASSALTLGANSTLLTEIATPANPSADDLKVYALDDGGVTKLATLDSAGTETILGSGSSGAQPISGGYTTNVWYLPPEAQTAATTGVGTNTVRFVPFEVWETVTFDDVGIEAVNTAGNMIRLGYYDSVDGEPDTLQATFGEVDVTTTGQKTISGINLTLNPGLYYIAVHGESGGNIAGYDNPSKYIGHPTTIDIPDENFQQAGATYASGLPATATVIRNSSNTPLVGFRL